MAKPVLGKSLCSGWFFLGQEFAVRTVSMETVQSVYFCFEQSRQIQPEMHFTIGNRVPYNKLLINQACSGRTGEFWPSVAFAPTEHSKVRTVTT